MDGDEDVVVDDAAVQDASTEAKTERILQRRLDKAQQYLPSILAEWVAHLRQPSASWVRVPLGILLILGSVFSFLPVLGLWMLPLGLVLLSLDIALLRRPTARMLVAGERWWNRRRRGWRAE